MYCQKCRQPIRIDGSIHDLNPASFDLLATSTGKSQSSDAPITQLNYPQERKEAYDRVSVQASSPVYKRTIPPPQDDSLSSHSQATSARGQGIGNPGMSFIEITQSQVAFPQKGRATLPEPVRQRDEDGHTGGVSKDPRLSTQRDRVEYLFAILSSQSDIDHPMCSECTAIMLSHLSNRLNSANKERDAYAGFLKSAQQAISSPPTENGKTGQNQSPAIKDHGRTLFAQLEHVESEARNMEEQIRAMEDQIQQEDLNEQSYWACRNSVDDDLHQKTSHLQFLREKQTHDFQQLERLQRTNVYNDTFCIGHDGYFGTINGLRLGRLPAQNVDWSEINAAWGQTLLLLATVAEKLRFNFQGYRLRPQGSTSRIEKLEFPQQSPDLRQSASIREGAQLPATANPEPKITPLDLFSSGDMAIGRLLNHRRFDGGMVAFLDCLGQLGKHVEKTSSSDASPKIPPNRIPTSRNPPSKRILPYSIQGDKIGDVSIKLGVGFHQDENFTKACKYALTCCKFLLAHVSNLESQKEA